MEKDQFEMQKTYGIKYDEIILSVSAIVFYT